MQLIQKSILDRKSIRIVMLLIVVIILASGLCNAQGKDKHTNGISIENLSQSIDNDLEMIKRSLLDQFTDDKLDEQEIFLEEFLTKSKEAKIAYEKLKQFIDLYKLKHNKECSNCLTQEDIDFLDTKKYIPTPVVAFLAQLQITLDKKAKMIDKLNNK